MRTVSAAFLVFLLAGCGSVALVQRAEWEAQKTEIDRLNRELRQVQKQIDERHRAQVQEFQLLKADLNALLAGLGQNLDRIQGGLEENKYQLDQLSKTTDKLSSRKFIVRGADSAAAAESVLVEDKVDVQKLFKLALEDFQAREYGRALKAFEDLKARFPEDELVDNCLYWAGECQYVQKKYKEALAAYRKCTADFPKGDVAAAALFKAGLCHQKLNQPEKAKEAWKELIARHPNADEALQAKARMGR
jgi:tol-pal system protein YbgF